MAVQHINITLTQEEIAFISDRNLSPTQLLKEKIHEIMALSAHTEILLREEQRKRQFWQEAANDYRVWVEKKGLMDEFLNQDKEKNGI